MSLKRQVKMYKFLPNALEQFNCHSSVPLDKMSSEIPQTRNLLGIARWQSGRRKKTHWFKLNALNKYIILPVISFKKLDSESDSYNYLGEVKYSALSKKILQLWLFMCLVVYSVLPAYIVLECVFGDGLMAYTHNGVKQPDLNVFPWLLIFLVIHFIVFFVYPATVVSMGWRKTLLLRDEILERMVSSAR